MEDKRFSVDSEFIISEEVKMKIVYIMREKPKTVKLVDFLKLCRKVTETLTDLKFRITN